MMVHLLLTAGLLWLAAGLSATPALAGPTLDTVKANKAVRCGVSEGLLGFSLKDESGRWQGRNGGYRQGDASTGGGWRSNDGNRTDAARGGYRQGEARYTSRTGNRDGGFGNRVIRDAERANGGNRYDGQR